MLTLTLTANDPVQLQKMLRQQELYAAREGLTVSVQKSYIVKFNAYRNSAVPVFRLLFLCNTAIQHNLPVFVQLLPCYHGMCGC